MQRVSMELPAGQVMRCLRVEVRQERSDYKDREAHVIDAR